MVSSAGGVDRSLPSLKPLDHFGKEKKKKSSQIYK